MNTHEPNTTVVFLWPLYETLKLKGFAENDELFTDMPYEPKPADT